jgi:hypothetical protein
MAAKPYRARNMMNVKMQTWHTLGSALVNARDQWAEQRTSPFARRDIVSLGGITSSAFAPVNDAKRDDA